MRHAQTGPTGATTTATSAGLAAFRRTERTRFASTPFGFGSVSKSFRRRRRRGRRAGDAPQRKMDTGARRDALRPRDAARPSRLGGLGGGRRPAQAAQATKATATAARRRRGGGGGGRTCKEIKFWTPHAIDATSSP